MHMHMDGCSHSWNYSMAMHSGDLHWTVASSGMPVAKYALLALHLLQKITLLHFCNVFHANQAVFADSFSSEVGGVSTACKHNSDLIENLPLSC